MKQNKKFGRIGVYQITNLLKNKKYIASCIDLDSAWHNEKILLNEGVHSNSALCKAWQEDGKENFQFDILAEIHIENAKLDYEKGLYLLESKLKMELQPYGEEGYNLEESITIKIPNINLP